MKKIYPIVFSLLISICGIQAQTGNVGIGTATPDASAILDISSTSKGLLIPRVSVSSAATFGLTGSTSTAGMIVYNTNAAITGGSGVGFYFWNGASWVKVVTGTTATLTDGKIWIGDASNNPVEQSMSGDVLISNTGATTIQDNAVDGTDITITGESNGSLMYFNGTDWVNVAPGTSGQILRTNGAAAPTWQNPNDLFVFENGLTETAPNIVRLGGTLLQATTITQGAYNMISLVSDKDKKREP